jgi:hypothetical protein
MFCTFNIVSAKDRQRITQKKEKEREIQTDRERERGENTNRKQKLVQRFNYRFFPT